MSPAGIPFSLASSITTGGFVFTGILFPICSSIFVVEIDERNRSAGIIRGLTPIERLQGSIFAVGIVKLRKSTPSGTHHPSQSLTLLAQQLLRFPLYHQHPSETLCRSLKYSPVRLRSAHNVWQFAHQFAQLEI